MSRGGSSSSGMVVTPFTEALLPRSGHFDLESRGSMPPTSPALGRPDVARESYAPEHLVWTLPPGWRSPRSVFQVEATTYARRHNSRVRGSLPFPGDRPGENRRLIEGGDQ